LIDNKVRKNKKLSDFFKNNELENRSSLQKQLRSLDDRERNSVRRQLINFCTSQNEAGPQPSFEKVFINRVFTDATDKSDILIIRDRRSKNIKGVLSVSLFEDTYMINFLSYDNDEKMGGFMIMVYLLCLNENKLNKGLLILDQGREERELLCLADKYGFVVNENYRGNENFPNAVFMEVKLVDGDGRRVLKAKIVNTYLEKCRKFQRQERECGANGYGQNLRMRRNAVQNVEEEGSEEEGEI
jgi:ribosomal protein L37E